MTTRAEWLRAELADALAVPGRDEVERVVVGVLDPRALHLRVEVGHVDELRAAPVGRGDDLANDLLHGRGRPTTVTICPGCTFAPTPTASSASRSASGAASSGVNRGELPGAVAQDRNALAVPRHAGDVDVVGCRS